MLETRRSLRPEEMERWDNEIMKQLLSIDSLKSADVVYCYVGVRGETGTRELIKYFLDAGLRVAVPRVKGRTMSFYYIKSHEDLEPGGFGIPEPVSSCEPAECKDAPVIVPGVAFSKRFERTGYGAGYYDKFFAMEPEHEKIAVCYDFQLLEELESDSFDVPMDYVVTPSEVLCRKEPLDA